MDAVRWHGAGDVRLEEVDRPEAPGPGRVLVEVMLCGICGSDLTEFRDGPKLIRRDAHPLTGQAPPITLGHEFVGRVVHAEDHSAWSSGVRVTADACWRCGVCEACRVGEYHRCRLGGSIGLHSDGAFAERVVVPEYCLVEVPSAVSDEQAALSEPLAVALHALDRVSTRPAEDVLVVGFGPIGAATALLARGLGSRVHVAEISPVRRARADELGFPTVEAGEEVARAVRRALGSGGADVVVETTGSAAALADAIDCARRGGRIALAGITPEPSQIPSNRLVLFERSLVGSLGYQNDVPRVVRLVELGVIDPSVLVGEIVPLSGAVEAIETLSSAPDGRLKVLVDPRR
jgi:(R,R)-butanediol dehydrogenase/meso-butanediol dehydrogenase/diacetyl reductase